MSRAASKATKAAKAAKRPEKAAQRRRRPPSTAVARAMSASTAPGPSGRVSAAAPVRRARGPAALEREADRTADAVLAGAVGLASGLSATQPARASVTRSPGRPLPADVRGRLEHSLGAELSRVRIHDDAASHWVAAHEGAAAFAAGPDIFFGDGELQPGTDAGFRLLAHEVAHTLQQTGRVSTGGLRRVTDARGSGEIQATDDFLDRFDGQGPDEVFAAVTVDHGGDATDSPIESYARAVGARLGHRLDAADPAYERLVTDVFNGTHGATTVEEWSYLLDLMKAGREWEAAASLIELASEPLATKAPSTEFLDRLSGDGLRPPGWAAEVVEETPGLRTYRNLVYGAFRIFLVRPDKLAYGLSDADALKMVVPPSWATGMWPDDRVTLAARQLAELESTRYAVCREIDERSGSRLVTEDEEIRGFGRNPVFRAWYRTGQLKPVLAEWLGNARAEGGPLQVRAVTWFEERRQRAFEFWQRALDLWNTQLSERFGTGRIVLSEERRALLRQDLGANPVAVEAAAKVAAAGVVVLAAERAQLPDATTYGGWVATFREVLDKQLVVLWADLTDFRLTPESLARAALVPWLGLRLESLRQLALAYVPKEDTSGFDDTRHGHRLKLADELRRLAHELDLTDLEHAAEDVQTNEAGTQSRLVLISDWRKPPESDPDQIPEDLKQIRLSDAFLLDAQAVADFYKLIFLERLADSIEMMLGPDARDAWRDRLLLKAAVEAAKAGPTPSRWVVDESDWAPREDEVRTVARIVEEHPKSQAQLPIAAEDSIVVFPGHDTVGSLGKTPHLRGVFAWELPGWGELAGRVALALAKIPGVVELVGPVGADPLLWLSRLEEKMGNRLGPTLLEVSLRFSEEMRAGVQVQRERLGVEKLPPGLLREATNHDRAVVVARVTKHLEAYRDDRRWEDPVDALDLIEQFHRYAVPTSDNLAQTAALIIELAGELRATFVQQTWLGEVVERRYDMVTGYYGFVLVAQAWLKDPQRRAQLTTSFLHLSDDELAARTTDLVELRKTLDLVQLEVQSGRGFESTSSGGLRSLNYPYVITTEHQFGTSGWQSFELMKVFKRFLFNPKYGEEGEPVKGVKKVARPASVVDATTKKPLAPETVLMRIRFNDRPTDVRASDVDLLDDIWRAVEDKAFQLSMENLQQAMKDIAMLAIDLAELVPGPGQAVMIGRIVLSVATFLASADFDDIKAIVTGELLEQITGLAAGLERMLDPDEIWMYLLFGSENLFLEKLAEKAGPAKKARPVTRRPGRLGRLLRILLSLGKMIALEVEKLQDLARPPLRNTQSFVVTHPVVATVVNLAADAIAAGPQVAEGFDEIAEFAKDPAGEFAERVDELVSVIEQFELPTEIIPNAALVAAIVGMILGRFGAKGKLIRAALEVTGAMDEIGQMVAARIPEIANPNNLWLTTVRPKVDDALSALRNDFIDGIYGALATIGLGGVDKPPVKRIGPKLISGPDSGEDDAAEPALAPGHPPSLALDRLVPARGGDVVPPGPGSPLPAHPRAAAETGFGRSFEHVRLHRATLGEGVDAITRGSHVVMRPGLSLDVGRGRHVLRHELGHVAQHTGDEPHPRPTRGRPGTSVRFDPEAEAGADRAADHGVAPRRTSGDAAAPSLSADVVAKILRKTASFEELQKYQEEIHAPVSMLPSLTTQQLKDVNAVREMLVDALKSKVRQLPIARVPRSAGRGTNVDTHDLVRTHAANAGERIRTLPKDHPEAVDRLGRRALHEVRSKKPKENQVQELEHELVPKDLAALIEGYLLVRTGLMTAVKLPHDPLRFETWVRSPSSTLHVEVNGVFLGAATKASKLWAPIFNGQLAVGQVQTGTPPTSTDDPQATYAISTAEDQDDLFHAVVARLRTLGPTQRSLQLDRYALPVEVLQRAVDTLAIGLDISPDSLPSPSSYVETELRGGVEIGLRIATHGKLHDSTSKNRHSHHTTQFLFAQYLTHRAGREPFFPNEPGLERAAEGNPKVLHRADGKDPVELGKLYGKEGARGDPMPAILIAHTTHERSDLHVASSKPAHPDDLGGRASQGSTVHSWFRAIVKSGPTAEEQQDPADDPAKVGSAKEPLKARNRLLVAAVVNVHKEMSEHMMPRLKEGLRVEEKLYYDTIAARRESNLDEDKVLKPEFSLDPARLLDVHKKAEENDRLVMALHGITP